MEEWIIDQFLRTLEEFGLKKPWYWHLVEDELDIYHHMIYASAYTYRATLWFNFVLPCPAERAWLRQKYPKYWDRMDAVWEQIAEQWRSRGPGAENELTVHGTALPAFCDLCQLPLSAGSPDKNSANVLVKDDRKYIFCSEPCRWIFLKEPERYANHLDLVKRVLSGKAPADLPALLTEYFRLTPETCGNDFCHGNYDWLRTQKSSADYMHVIQRWIDKWHPLAARAVQAFAPVFEGTLSDASMPPLRAYPRSYKRTIENTWSIWAYSLWFRNLSLHRGHKSFTRASEAPLPD